jgi:hypothetical protein
LYYKAMPKTKSRLYLQYMTYYDTMKYHNIVPYRVKLNP